MEPGPNRIDHAERLKIAEEIAGQLKEHFTERVMAISIYGSLARGTDGLYSDIEMDCVLDGLENDHSLEWCGGDWKAEIDFFSVSSILKKAAEVGPKWPISHGIYVHYLPVYDPTNLYVHRRKTALSQPDYKFRRAMRDLIIEEMFEIVGKIRNAGQRREFTGLPYYTTVFAHREALLLGLANRHLYSTSARIFEESMGLDVRPEGYDVLCGMVMKGTLSDPEAVLAACDNSWHGVTAWAREHSIKLVDDFGELLAQDALLA